MKKIVVVMILVSTFSFAQKESDFYKNPIETNLKTVNFKTGYKVNVTDAKDIAVGRSEIVDMGWSPKVNEHTCIRVEIWRHNSGLSDINPWNDVTQENVSSFHRCALTTDRDRASRLWIVCRSNVQH